MGIGLVQPILPALSTQLNASPSQVTLLFTSCLVVTAVAMLERREHVRRRAGCDRGVHGLEDHPR